MKDCTKCGESKPLSEFYRHRRLPGGRHYACKDCQAAYAKSYNAQPDKRRLARARHLSRYGLTLETFDALLSAQGGCCAICGTDDPGGVGAWHVDHDHSCCSEAKGSCGRCVRGLLCMKCNHRVGIVESFGDAISAYLRKDKR